MMPLITVACPLLGITNFGVRINSPSEDSSTLQSGISMVARFQIPKFLAVTTDNTFFSELTTGMADTCLNSHEGICPVITNYMTAYTEKCIVLIFLDDPNGIKLNSKFVIYSNHPLTPSLIRIKSGHFLLNNLESPIQVVCPYGAKHIAIDNQNIVKIPCLCSIDQANISLCLLYIIVIKT